MVIRSRNLLDNQAQNTFLSTSAVGNVSSITVKNINGFSPSWAIQIGKTGEEQSEVAMLGTAAISGSTLTFTGTSSYPHATDSPVYAIKYDTIVFERSTVGTSGTATPITGGTVGINADSLYTDYDDTSGSTTYAYRTYYQNSVTSEVSPESDWLTSGGFSFYSLAKIRDRIKRKLISSNYVQSDEIIDDWINEWLEKMTNAAIDVNRDYMLGNQSISLTSGQEMGTVTATDFKELRRMWVVTSSGTATAARMNLTDYRADQVFTESMPQYYWKGDNVFGEKPTDNSRTIVVDYYKRAPVMVNDTDEIPISMQNYTKSFVDYGYAQACFLDQKDEKGYAFINMANGELAEFKTQIAPRWKSGPQYVNVVSPLSSDDDFQLI